MQLAVSDIATVALSHRLEGVAPDYGYYPGSKRFHDAFNARAYMRQLRRRVDRSAQAPLALYVHLPFCASECHYCSCHKLVSADRSRSGRYLAYLEREMELVSAHLGSDRRTVQLRLGGGTPTFLSQRELQKLVLLLQTYFDLDDETQFCIEIDPRTVDAGSMAFLGGLGFRYATIGVQDLDQAVLQAVNRTQPAALVEQALSAARGAGFRAVGFDLICGLPRQTVGGFAATTGEVVRMAPDRIALRSYMHQPQYFDGQRGIAAADLPSAGMRLQMFLQAVQQLLDAGYVHIGLDQFAMPDDELAQAQAEQALHLDLQGYTRHAGCDLIGLGMSSIGKIGNSYCQSTCSLDEYYAELDAGCLPIARGMTLSDDDLVRREVIMALMCSGELDFHAVGAAHGIDFRAYFAAELAALAPHVESGMVALDATRLRISPQGRLFARAIGAAFDKYAGVA